MHRTVDETDESTLEMVNVYTVAKQSDKGKMEIHETVKNVPFDDDDDGKPSSDVEYLLLPSVED